MTLIDGDLPRGLRNYVWLIVQVCEFYLRYKPGIDAYVPQDVVAAMMTLTAACEVLKGINPPGPY